MSHGSRPAAGGTAAKPRVELPTVNVTAKNDWIRDPDPQKPHEKDFGVTTVTSEGGGMPKFKVAPAPRRRGRGRAADGACIKPIVRYEAARPPTPQSAITVSGVELPVTSVVGGTGAQVERHPLRTGCAVVVGAVGRKCVEAAIVLDVVVVEDRVKREGRAEGVVGLQRHDDL